MVSLLIVGLLVERGSTVQAELEGDVELLNLVAKTHRNNKQQIMTWRGRVVRTAQVTPRNGPERHYLCSMDFAYDREQQATRWKFSYDRYEHLVDGQREEQPNLGFYNGLLKDGACYRLQYKPLDEGHRTVLIYPPDEPGFGPMSHDFDPFYFFTDHGEPLEQRFGRLYEIVAQSKRSQWSVKRAGDVITLESDNEMGDSGKRLINRYEVDLSQGGNLVGFFGSSPINRETATMEYEQQAGIWVPRVLDYENVQIRQGTEIRTSQCRMEWTQNIINEPTPADEFSLEKLGARSGDFVQDTRSGVEYRIGGEEENAEHAGPEVLSESGRSAWPLLIAVNAILVGLILAIVVWRRVIKKPAG